MHDSYKIMVLKQDRQLGLIEQENLHNLQLCFRRTRKSMRTMINYDLNTIMLERSVKVHADDCLWITKDLKRLIFQRQKAFIAGKMSPFKLLRNKVNRERKRCRKSYY